MAQNKLNERQQAILDFLQLKKSVSRQEIQNFVSEHFDKTSRATIRHIEDLHKLLTNDLDITSGIRNHKVGIIGMKYRPLDNAKQIKEALEQLVALVNQTENPIEKALICVLMISYIHPFEDGNKRTSRILANAVLLANDYCPLSYRNTNVDEYKKAILLFYEQNNTQYFKKLFIDQFKFAVDTYF
ncbi:MAG: Fic family protein [Deltaproteobacteria bacterium]|jgi:Fic family protein|nr:Fic family protein [Deltaproteobacteria bacterium]